MKKISQVILFITIYQFAYGQFQFISPLPGSKNIPVLHNIIIRQQNELDPTSVMPSLFKIEGSKSGVHIFKLILCDDGKTINLLPEIPFEFDETVTVSILKGLISKKKNVIGGYSFTFSTHRKWTKEEEQKIKDSRLLLMEEELNPPAEDDGTVSALKISGMFTITTNINPSPGQIFFDVRSALTPPSAYNSISVINNNGDSVFQRTFNVFPYDFRIAKNGYLETFQGNIEKFLVMDSNFAVIDTYAAANGYTGDPHDLELLPNGYAFLIAKETQFMALVDTADSAQVIGSVIQEFDPDHNVVFEWRSFDHIALDEAEHVNFGAQLIDYIHTNSIEVDTDGNIIVSHRHLEQITKIDVNTGEFIWRLGGVNNEFTFLNDSIQFSYQHDCRRLSNGNITLYDNGDFHVPAKSYAREYQLDEVNKTAELVWNYSHPDVNGYTAYYSSMGSVQRLSNGNTLIDWGYRTNTSLPNISEVDVEGNIVWELKMTSAQNLIDYRAHKYDWDPCARPTFGFLKTEDITSHSATLMWSPVANPSQQYEIQYKKQVDSVWITKKTDALQHELELTDLVANTEYDWRIQSWCDTVAGESSNFTDTIDFTTLLPTLIVNPRQGDVELYPNPANGVSIISCLCKLSKIRIINVLGQEMMSISANEGNVDPYFELPVSNLPPGNYFVEVTHGGVKEMKKLMIQ